MNWYVGQFVLPAAGNRIGYVLPKTEAEGPNVARQRILRTVNKLAVAGVWIGGEIAWLPSKDVLRWWERANLAVVEAAEAGL